MSRISGARDSAEEQERSEQERMQFDLYEVTNDKSYGRQNVREAAHAEGPNTNSISCGYIKLCRYVAENEEISSSASDNDQDGRKKSSNNHVGSSASFGVEVPSKSIEK